MAKDAHTGGNASAPALTKVHPTTVTETADTLTDEIIWSGVRPKRRMQQTRVPVVSPGRGAGLRSVGRSPAFSILFAVAAVAALGTGIAANLYAPIPQEPQQVAGVVDVVMAVNHAPNSGAANPLIPAVLTGPEPSAAQPPPTSPLSPLAKSHYAERFADVSPSEKHCLTRAVYFEARGEPMAGQIAVAQVILNRVGSGRWPSTICGVINQGVERGSKCQFSFACGRQRPAADREAWAQAAWIAEDVLNGGAWLGEMLAADHFHHSALRPVWRLNLQVIRQIGHHIFYAAPTAIVDRTWIPQQSDSKNQTVPELTRAANRLLSGSHQIKR